MTADDKGREGPRAGVTLAVARRARAGQAAELERWIHELVEAVASFRGHQGVSIVRPGPGRPEYLVLLRFGTVEDLRRWRRSRVCRELVAEAEKLTEGPARLQELHGLEAWFDSGGGQALPPRWKMAIVTWLAIYPALAIVTFAVTPIVADWPLPLRLLLTTAILVPLMTWVLMPATTRVARRWLVGRGAG